MYKLGVTGGIGSGKSTACNFFLKKGAFVFDADKEAKKYLSSHANLQNLIINTFGDTIKTDNSLDIIKLSELVFSNKKYLQLLNKIMWPKVYSLIKSAENQAVKDHIDFFVVDAALLLEAEYTDFFNSILLLTTKKSIRIKRIKKRNNIPEEQIIKRMSLQMPDSQKKKLAQSVILNNGSLNELYAKLELFWKNICLNP